jgi:hypothetical protein
MRNPVHIVLILP